MINIGIIGASGFIGKNLTQFLKEKEEYTLFPTSRKDKPGLIKLNLDFDKELVDFCKKIDILFYLAHEGGPNQPFPTESAIEKNIPPLQNLLKSVKTANKSHPLKIIYFSSGGTVYGVSKDKHPWKETDPLRPVSSYGHAKIRAEKLLEMASEYGICKSICVRASNPYGNHFQHEKLQGVIDVIISRLANQQPFNLYDSLETVRDYIHLDDLNEALLKMINFNSDYDVFNIGSSKGTSLGDLIGIIEKISNEKLAVNVNPVDERINSVPWSVLDIEKSRKILGWSPRISLEAGIRQIITQKINQKQKP